MTNIHTGARGIKTAKQAADEHQRRGIQSATEAVQDVLDAWPDELKRPDVRDAVVRARAALWEAKRRLVEEATAVSIISGVISADNTLLKAVPTPFEGTGEAIVLGGPISFKEDA
jgi:hypothetical protein